MITFPDHGDVVVGVWPDALVEAHGHPVRSEYVEVYWLPVIGPTALCIARRLGVLLDTANGDEVCVNLHDLSKMMGLSMTKGEHSPFGRAINRLARFGLACPSPYGFLMRTTFPTVAGRHVRYFPDVLQAAHELELADR